MTQVDESSGVAYYNSLPGIRIGGGVLIFNKLGELLLVKPNYRNTWMWPGGGWDPGESPLQVAMREYTEELGVDIGTLKPAFINYIPPRSDGTKDVIHFVYTTEPVADNFLDTLTLQKSELDDAKFVPLAELGDYMKEYRVRALKTYLNSKMDGAMLYLEDGLLV
jgi:8-oxo-dGTP pyrophosphatase MutT (NUDIX family)